MPEKKKTGLKYLASGLDEFQPDSRRKVLRNLLNITSVRQMEDEELAAYMMAERELVGVFTAEHRFTLKDVNVIHKAFLGHIYPWAGRYRDVNLSKGGFLFAFARAVPQAMRDFEHNVLRKHSPCRKGQVREVAAHLAAVHTELLLIHPYREGNGRTARLLATLMAYQAGMPGLDFGFIGGRGREFEAYVSAIQAGIDEEYRPMAAVMERALTRALRKTR